VLHPNYKELVSAGNNCCFL